MSSHYNHCGQATDSIQTAKINLDVQVLNLLQFNAGVDLSIDEVNLLIQNVNVKVLLEARLENVVKMFVYPSCIYGICKTRNIC